MAFPKVGLRRIKRKKGFVYQIDYTLNGKRIREIVGPKKSDAELYRSKIQTDILHGKLGVPQKISKVSFKQLYVEYTNLKQNLSANSRQRYQSYYNEFNFFFKRYFPICLSDIITIKTSYIKESIDHFIKKGTSNNRTWKPKTANGYKVFLASLFKYGIRKKYLLENPVSGIPDLTIEKRVAYEFYSKKEIEVILNNIHKHWYNYFVFLLNTGLRTAEINNLTWKKVDIENRKIYITSSENWDTKGKKGRILKLNDTALNIIKEQQNKHEKYVFTQENGINIPRNKSLRILQSCLKNIGIHGDVHKFRHTFASHYMMSGAGSIYDLQKILGHKDIKHTMIYAHLSEDHQLKTMQRLNYS